MRKLITAFKVSLDGKSEGPQGFADWVDAWSEDYGLTNEIDACIVGGGMFPVTKPIGPRSGMNPASRCR